jgi:hypothetical protein
MKFDSNRHLPIDAEFGNTDGLHGVHDIHMMQGNVGEHAADNSAFRDGALLLAFPDRIDDLPGTRADQPGRSRSGARGRRVGKLRHHAAEAGWVAAGRSQRPRH